MIQSHDMVNKHEEHEKVVEYIKAYLRTKGYQENEPDARKNKKPTGADIEMTNVAQHKYIVECKSGKQREAFLHGLGQLCTRMDREPKGVKYGLALPEEMAMRAIKRIQKNFAQRNAIYLLSVDLDNGQVKEYSPSKMLGTRRA